MIYFALFSASNTNTPRLISQWCFSSHSLTETHASQPRTPRKAVWSFVCDVRLASPSPAFCGSVWTYILHCMAIQPTVTVGPITVTEGSSDPCTYNINFPTKYACKHHAFHFKSSSGWSDLCFRALCFAGDASTCGFGDIDLSPLTVPPYEVCFLPFSYFPLLLLGFAVPSLTDCDCFISGVARITLASLIPVAMSMR